MMAHQHFDVFVFAQYFLLELCVYVYYAMLLWNMEIIVKYHGVLKQVKYGLPYNYHVQNIWKSTVYRIFFTM